MKFIKLLLTIGICSTALFGDYVVFMSKPPNTFVFRAIADNCTHALIGCLSALLFCCEQSFNNNSCLINVVFCTIVSSLIDVDHVFVAKSLHLKDYTVLKDRGIFHCTSFWLLITAVLLTYSYIYKKPKMYIATWMLILAYTSHHIRDANKRGLWLYPFGHTPALSKFLYVFLVSVLPHSFSYLYVKMKPLTKNSFEHTQIV